MKSVLLAYGRAMRSQLKGRMLLLSVVPLVLSLLLWGTVLFFGFQPLIDFLTLQFIEHEVYRFSSAWLTTLGLAAVKTIIVPLAAILALLPLMILTALIFIGVAAMPAIVRHVGSNHYPQLEQKQGGSIAGSVGVALRGFCLFAAIWLVALPLYLFPPAALALQVCLWGWLTSRVMAYDALADYASREELAAIRHSHRWPLMAIGIASGAAGALPGVAWMVGTAATIVLFPFLAAISLWLYVLIFLFTGLWFQFYCLEALAAQRKAAPGDKVVG